MPTTEELLAQLEAEAQSETPVCVIDPETRTITVPPEYQLLGVENDKRVERIPFRCPKIVGDNKDLSQDFILFINYVNANGDPDAYKINDMQVDGDNITFAWLLEEKVTLYQGDIQISFCGIIPGDEQDDPDKNRWGTTINTDCTVLTGLKCTQQVAESNPDALAQIWAAIDELKAGGGGSGTPGKDGREIEIQNNGTAIQWRYVGDDAWTDLVQLSEITGTKGDPGDNGITPHIGENGNWYLGDEDTGKPSRGEKGDPGQKGDPGDKGDPGQTGATPNIQIGTVQTLDPGQQATASMSGTPENPLLNLGIPKGEKGDPGEGSEAEPYELPIMSNTQLGGGKAVSKTDEDVPVAVDSETGQLFVPTYPENSGTVDPEQIKQAVNDYLEENPVSGMTAEQEQQLNQNTTDVADLQSAMSNKTLPLGGTSGQVLSKKTDNDYDVEWKDIESSSAGSDLIFTNETNYSASVNDLEEVGENQYIPVTNSLMFIPSLDGILKVGSENLIGEPYSGSVNELVGPTVYFEKIQDGYSLSYNPEYTGVKILSNQRFGFTTSLKANNTYTISLNNDSPSNVIYVYGCNTENESGDLLGTIQDEILTFTVNKDYIYIRIPCSNLPENLTKITLANGEVALEYGGSATEYSVIKNVPLYIKNVKGLNCVGSGKFYAAPFAIVELNNMRTHGSAKTYSTDKYYVNMGDSIWTFGSSTGGIGNISDYMKELCGGIWINICTGGTTMANRPGEYAGEYDALDFHALADCIYTGDFTSAKGSGLTTNLDTNADSIVWDDVDVITIAYGTNDLAFGGIIDNSENLYDKNTVCGALRYGIERINSKYPNIKFKVCGILYRFSDGISISDIVEWNEGIKKACVSVGAEYVDMSCGINGGNRTSFLYDGTHPNANGKEAIAKALAKTIINI